MDTNFKLLPDDALSAICGGLEIDLVTPGHTVSLPDGLVNGGFQTGNFVGILNGTAPFFGDQDPVYAIVTP